MSVRTLLFRRRIPWKVRFQAWLNVMCAAYMWTMTLAVTHVTFFFIIPQCYAGDDLTILSHRLFVWYMFTLVVGNYVTCMATETKVKRRPRRNVKDKREPDAEPKHSNTENQGLKQRKKGHSAAKDATNSKCVSVALVAKNKTNRTRDSVASVAKDTSKVTRNSVDVIAKETKGLYCITCDIHVPLRTHHCYLCEKCVTKRDHHCFFMGVCIGKDNHVYFILFTLYMGIGTFYGLLFIAKYLYFLYGVQFHGPQTFITLFLSTMKLLLNGRLPPMLYLACFVLLYISLAGTTISFGFFSWHMWIASRGQTTFEARHGIHKFSKGSILSNMKQVFNDRWIISALVPFWDLVMTPN